MVDVMSKPKLDAVADAVANAPLDERPVTEEERRAIGEASQDPQPTWVDGDEVSRRLAERARREARPHREG